MRPGAWRPGRSELGALKLRSSRDGRSSGEPGCPGDLGELGIWGIWGVRVSWGSGGSGVLARRDLRLASLLQVRSLPRMSISGSPWGCSSCAAAGALPRPLPVLLWSFSDLLRAFPVFASAALRLALVVPRLASTAAQLASAALRLDVRIGASSRVLFQSSFFFAPNRPATKEETIAVMIAPKRQDRKPPVEKGKPSCVDSQPVNLKRTEFVTIAKSPKLNR